MAGILGNFDIYGSGAKSVSMPDPRERYPMKFPYTDFLGNTWETEEEWKEFQRRQSESMRPPPMTFPFTDMLGHTWETKEEWEEFQRRQSRRFHRPGLPRGYSHLNSSVVNRPNISERYMRR